MTFRATTRRNAALYGAARAATERLATGPSAAAAIGRAALKERSAPLARPGAAG